jgi:hypothetical protein
MSMVILMSTTNSFLELLARAAQVAAKDGVDSETFVSAAYNAMLDASPGLREELVDRELRKQLKTLRRQGLIGLA